MASLLRNADIAPDAAIASTKLAAWAAHRSANGFKLTGLAAGTDPGDAVNKAQLDAAVSSSIWGGITGTLSDQTDLQSALDAKQPIAGRTTVGQSFFTLANPSAITFPRINADNTVSALSDSAFRTAIGAGTGSGTVTAISIASLNGVSGSSSGGSTPALTIALGAITPSSVAATGTVAGTNLSGTNTGDQTITLSGDVSGSGTSGITATIGTGVVTYAKIQNVTTNRLLGRSTALSGVMEEILIGTGLSLSSGTLTATDAGGTVTNVAATGANGIGVSGSPITTTGTIALSLGAITPASVAVTDTGGLGFVEFPIQSSPPSAPATGYRQFADTIGRLSWIRAGNAFTRTLTTTFALTADRVWAFPDVTGTVALTSSTVALATALATGRTLSITGDLTWTSPSFDGTANVTAAGTIASGAVTYAKIQNVSTNNRLLGRSTAGAGIIEEITVGSGLSLSAGTLTATDAGGTVTNVAVTGANGIGVSGSPITTTGTIELSLGAITPTTVNGLTLTALATGFTIAGGTTSKTLTVPLDASVSGTNTGDQIVPGNTPAVSNQFLSAYNSSTGVFTQTQPSFTNLSGSVAYTQIQNVVGLSVFGRSASSTGVGSDITGTANQVLRVNSAGNLLIFGTVAYAGIQNVAALSVFGRSANSAGVGADITGTDGQALRVSGTTLGFGTLLPGSIAMSADSRLLGRGNPGAPTAVEIVLGPGLNIKNNQLSTQAFLVQQERFSGAPTVASAGTLDLSATPEAFVDITGTTNISAVTLAVDEVKALRFTGAGLTLANSASLLLPGGADLPTTLNGVAQVIGTAAGVMITGYHNEPGYSVQTFDKIFMRTFGNIGFDDQIPAVFDIGYSPLEYTGTPSGRSFIRMHSGGEGVCIVDGGSEFYAKLDTSLITSGLKIFKFPNYSGTFSTITGTESLTNKKLGSLTTNGFVKTSGSDGTLSVDTATYLTSAAIGVSIQAYDADLTTWAGITPGANVATFLATPSSANLLAAVTGETGTDMLVFSESPTLGAPVINGVSTGTGVAVPGTPDTLVMRDAAGGIEGTDIYGTSGLFDIVVQTAAVSAATGTPITLDYQSPGIQIVTGTSTNTTFNLPVATTLAPGYKWVFKNEQTGTGTLIIRTNGASSTALLFTIAPGCEGTATCKNPAGGTGTASWSFTYHGSVITTAKKFAVTHSLTLAGTDGTTHTFPSTSCSVARIDASQTFAEAADFAFGTTTGTKIGTSVSQKLAFHNSTPVIQRVGAAQAAVATTAATNVTPYGFTTAAQADGIVTLLNEIRAALTEKGLIKGAA